MGKYIVIINKVRTFLLYKSAVEYCKYLKERK